MGKRLAKKDGPIKIKLPCGEICLIDQEDSKIIQEFPYWRLHKRRKGGGAAAVLITRYIKTDYGNVREDRYLHRIIMHSSPKRLHATQVDHKDRDPLNNQKDNLRWVSSMENSRNSTHRGKEKTSRHRGVFRNKYAKSERWVAQIKVGDRAKHLGSFKTEKEAALAYNAKSKELYGEYGWQNSI